MAIPMSSSIFLEVSMWLMNECKIDKGINAIAIELILGNYYENV